MGKMPWANASNHLPQQFFRVTKTKPLCLIKPLLFCYFQKKLTLTYAATKSLQSCPTLCNPLDGSPPGSLVPGILQAKTLEWAAISFCMKVKSEREVKVKSEREVAQSSPTVSNPMDCSLPGSSVHGIFQARILEWGAIAFSNINLYITAKCWYFLSYFMRTKYVKCLILAKASFSLSCPSVHLISWINLDTFGDKF